MSKLIDANKKIGKAVVSDYKAIENSVVSGYKAIENGVVKGYKKIEDKFVVTFLTPSEGSGKENTGNENEIDTV
jgi:hypothetical protein